MTTAGPKRPNILLVMADQLSASALPAYGNRVVRTPNLDALAARSAVFQNAYCAFPLCGPARAAFMTGRLASRIGVYDNASEFAASTPTIMHHLRLLGYSTSASGKMHFVGPDQLHGLEERLTNDIYPADFAWIPDWATADPRLAFQDMTNVLEAGPCLRSMQLDFDEMTFAKASQKIFDLARGDRENPFFLAVSFTHPHDPYVMTREFWDLYEDVDDPTVPFIAEAERDAHSRRLYRHYGMDRALPDDAAVRRARRGYYAAISYLDDRIGKVLRLLGETGLADDTIVVFTSDHGDMLGERGMWYKKTFFDGAMRIPLFVARPGAAASRVADPVSHLDLLPTLVHLAGGDPATTAPCDGATLLPLLDAPGASLGRRIYAEYCAEGVDHPLFMLRDRRYKFVWSETDPPLLFDMLDDPHERTNLASDAAHAAVLAAFTADLHRNFDPAGLRADIVRSQARHRLVQRAHAAGRRPIWDFTPGAEVWPRFVRSGDWTADIEGRAFLPAPST